MTYSKKIILLYLISLLWCNNAFTNALNDTDSRPLKHELPIISWQFNEIQCVESQNQVSFQVTLNKSSTQKITASIGILQQTALGFGVDYSLLSNEITFAPGQTKEDHTLTIHDDDLFELDEWVVFIIENPINSSIINPNLLTVTILNNDPLPSVFWDSRTQNVSENQHEGLITARIAPQSGLPAIIPFQLTQHTAIIGIDYNIDTFHLTIPAGQLTGTVHFDIMDNTINAPDKYFSIQMNAPENALLMSTYPLQVIIQDDDPLPTLSWQTNTISFFENTPLKQIPITLSSKSGFPIDVLCLAKPVSSNTQSSYTIHSLQIPPNQTNAMIQFDYDNNSFYESDQYVIINFDSLTHATKGNPNSITVTIQNDDAMPKINWLTPQMTVLENSGSINVPLALSHPSGISTYADISYKEISAYGNGVYFILDQPTMIIPPLTTLWDLTIPIIDNGVYHPNKQFIIKPTHVLNAELQDPKNLTITIIEDEDKPLVSWFTDQQTILENSEYITLTVVMDKPSGSVTQMPYTVIYDDLTRPGEDFILSNGFFSIPPGQLFGTIILYIVNDSRYEGNETFSIQLGQVEDVNLSLPKIHSITIQNDDPMPTIAWGQDTQYLSEGSGLISLMGTLSAPSGITIMVNCQIHEESTALGNGIDYSIANSKLIILPGWTFGFLDISLINDPIDEPIETVIITMMSAENASLIEPIQHQLYIIDNDPVPTVFWQTQLLSLQESQTKSLRILLSTPSSFPVTIDVNITNAMADSYDYSFSTRSIQFQPGEIEKSIPFTALDDYLDEPDESIFLDIKTSDTATVLNPTLEIVIVDTDEPVKIFFSQALINVTENTGSVLITAKLSAPSGLPITISLDTFNTGTAHNMLDYSIVNQDIIFQPENTTGEFQINLINDNMDEPTESIVLSFKNPQNVMIGMPNKCQITIDDDDSEPVISLFPECQLIQENAGIASLTVILSSPSAYSIILPYTIQGTALGSGIDYELSSNTQEIIILPETIQTQIYFSLMDDHLDEPLETIIFYPQNPEFAIINQSNPLTITIQDDDSSPIVEHHYFSIDENSQNETIVGTIQAEDFDNDPLVFSLIDGNYNQTFGIANNNNHSVLIIHDNKYLDFEFRPAFSLVLSVTDGTNQAIADILIHVNNINDNKPKALDAVFNIKEDQPLINTLKANDLDGDVLTYHILSLGELGMVRITNSVTGAFEYSPIPNMSGHDHFMFYVSDGLTDSEPAQVSVIIQDQNDPPVLSKKPMVAGGLWHNLALKADGSVWAWGDNRYGQCGLSQMSVISAPVCIQSLTQVIAIAAGDYHSLALTSDGRVWSWGRNQFGQLGDQTTINRFKPSHVFGLEHMIDIAAGSRGHSIALHSNGSLWAWGNNMFGQLGDGTQTNRSIPVQVMNSNLSYVEDIKSIAAGHYHSLALTIEGNVLSWGYNASGQLGDGSNLNQLYPVRVKELENIILIQTFGFHSIALKNDGSLWTWGKNDYGQLGISSPAYSNTPIRLQSQIKWKSIAAGLCHSMALDENGSLYSWGCGMYGQLGNGQTKASNHPECIDNYILPDTIAAISSGVYHSLAETMSGKILAWGNHTNGQISHRVMKQSEIEVPTPVIQNEGFCFELYQVNHQESSHSFSFYVWDEEKNPITIHLKATNDWGISPNTLTTICEHDMVRVSFLPNTEIDSTNTIQIFARDNASEISHHILIYTNNHNTKIYCHSGDIDCNDMIDIKDVLLIMQRIAEESEIQ